MFPAATLGLIHAQQYTRLHPETRWYSAILVTVLPACYIMFLTIIPWATQKIRSLRS